MPENHLFEYAILRVVPRVEREEFMNVGVVLYCQKQGFLQMKFSINEDRILAFTALADCAELNRYLLAFEKVCSGGVEGGPIGELDTASRFRWLTATRSTIVQTSRVHPGLCENAGEMLLRLYNQLVL